MSIDQYYLMASDVAEFFTKLFHTDDFMARWSCGKWTGFHGWVYIIADLMVFVAYFTIPALIFYVLRNKKSIPFKGVLVLFILFILFCGATHLMDAIIFWYPAYRFNGFLLVCTAIISWITVGALIKILPIAFSMKTTDELEVVLNYRTSELEHQKENLEDFAQIVSHNLRSPIASFTSLLELYDLKQTHEERDKIMVKFRDVLGRMNRSIDNMSEVVNWQLGVVQTESLSFGEVFRTVRTAMQGKIEEAGATIQTDLKGKDRINYPRVYLESVFLNLISNSLKYSKPGKPCEIRVETNNHKRGIKMIYRDNGKGLDMARFGHKLFQINQTFHGNDDARGIGLYLVKKHVVQMGGSIEVDSKVDEGMIFTIYLKDQGE